MYNQIAWLPGMKYDGEWSTTIEQIEDRIDDLVERTEKAIKELQNLRSQLEELGTSGAKVKSMLVNRIRPTLQDLKRRYAKIVQKNGETGTEIRYANDALVDPGETINCVESYIDAVRSIGTFSASPPGDKRKLIKSWFDQDVNSMAYFLFAFTRLKEARAALNQASLLLCLTLVPDDIMHTMGESETIYNVILDKMRCFVKTQDLIYAFLEEVETKRKYTFDEAMTAVRLVHEAETLLQAESTQQALAQADRLCGFLDNPDWKEHVSKTFKCWDWEVIEPAKTWGYDLTLQYIMQIFMRQPHMQGKQLLWTLNGIGYLYRCFTQNPPAPCIPYEKFLMV